MTFSSVRSKQKKFDRTFYKKMPYWISTKKKRTICLLLTVLVPLVCVIVVSLFPHQDIVDMVFSYIFSILLPLALFAIVFLIMFANDRNACVRAAVGKYSDNLLLGSTQLVYTYHNRTDSLYLRYEDVIPYDRINRIIIFPKLDLLVLETGGSFTVYEGNTVRHHTEFAGPAANELTRVDIPLVYPDNNLFLQQLQQATGRSILQNDTNNPDVL